MKRTSPTPTKMVVIKLWYLRESESGLACQFMDASTSNKVQHDWWLPVSQIYDPKKLPKEKGDDYPGWVMTIPEWLCEQKGLKKYIVTSP